MDHVDPVRLVVKHTFLELECNDETPVAFRRDRRSSDASVNYARFQGNHQDELMEAAAEYSAEHPNSPMRVPAAARMANDFTIGESAQEPSSPMRLPPRNKVQDPPREQPVLGGMHSRDPHAATGFPADASAWLDRRWEPISQAMPSRYARRRSSQLSDLSIVTDDSFDGVETASRLEPAPAPLHDERLALTAPPHSPPGQLGAGLTGHHENYIDSLRPPTMHGPPGQHGYVPPCPTYPPYVPGAGQMGYADPWWRQQQQQYGAAPGWPSVPYNMGQPPHNPALANANPHGGDASSRSSSGVVAPNGTLLNHMHASHRGRRDVIGNAGGCGASGRGAHYTNAGSYGAVAYGSAGTRMLATEGTSAGSVDGAVAGTQTTVMLRNLPEVYSRNMLVSLLDRHGFKGKYDFVYMPMNFRTKASFGYAFVNFVMPGDAQCCHTEFQGFTTWDVASQKVCDVSWSNMHQGLAAHIERYRNSPVMHESVPDEYKPAVYAKGHRAVFPGPTKKLRIPRIRRPNADAEGEEGYDDPA